MTLAGVPVGANSIQTYSGAEFDIWESGPESINVEDIAHSLSLQCRYNGHIRMFYSVAEHSLILSGWILAQTGDRQLALEALLHDASEAYLCDIPRPFKVHLKEYKLLEERVEKMIATKFALVYPWSPMIKDADTRILLDEQKTLMLVQRPWPSSTGCKPLGVRIRGLNPSEAKQAFLDAYRFLTN